VLPYTSKPLLDKVLNQAHPRPDLLPGFIALVFSAMVVQAITSFSLTQLLSKAGQRLIAEMRRQVQRHVGLLSVSYYDENRTGTLVARIMTDVEGVRNLVGTGLVEFVGGLLTAVLAFLYLLHLSVAVTSDGLCRHGRFRLCLAIRLQDHSSHLPRARQDQCRGHGPVDRVARRRAGHQGLSRRGARSWVSSAAALSACWPT
jgi:ABC-type multidrug transport system fused ATPase/permease subunit